MELKNFLKLMALVLIVPMAFTACHDDEIELEVMVEFVTLDKSSVKLEVGESTVINATLTPTDAADKNVFWTSSDSNVATVSEGKVTGVNQGSAIITVTSAAVPTVSASCTVYVEESVIAVESVTLDKSLVKLEIGESEVINVTVAPADATDKNISWTSSDPNVATISDGKVIAVHHGYATITATSAAAPTASASCTVYVDGDGVLIFNSGNMFSSIEGSLTLVRSEYDVTNNIFSTVNGRSLGSTVQDGVECGDNLYIAVDGSNTIEVVNKYTFESVTTIKPSQEQGEPRDIIEEDDMIYVSMYTGYVARINPATNQIDKYVEVGPNPEEMAVLGDYLYVVNSDGLNYEAGYSNGKSVSKIDLNTFTEVKKIPVGLNPTKMLEAGDNLYVLCMGNYGDIPSNLYKIDASDNVTDLGIQGTFMAEDDDVLYMIYYPYYEQGTTYTSYNLSDMSVKSSAFVDTRLDAPAGIAVEDGKIYISSYNLVDGYASYTTNGYLNEYTTDGTFVKKYDVGVGPANIYVMD